MTQHEKIADLLETVTLRCFACMFNPNAPVLPHLLGKDPITSVDCYHLGMNVS